MLWGIGGWVIACDHEVSIINYKHTFHIIEMVSLLLNSLLYLMVTLCTECHRIGGGISCASAIINLNCQIL